MKTVLEAIGRPVLRLLEGVGRFFELFGQTIRGFFRPPYQISMTAKQVVRVGVDSVPVVFLTALFTGGVLALQTFKGFQRFHAEGYIGSVVALSMLRELGPVLTGLMVTGRAGSAMTPPRPERFGRVGAPAGILGKLGCLAWAHDSDIAVSGAD